MYMQLCWQMVLNAEPYHSVDDHMNCQQLTRVGHCGNRLEGSIHVDSFTARKEGQSCLVDEYNAGVFSFSYHSYNNNDLVSVICC